MIRFIIGLILVMSFAESGDLSLANITLCLGGLLLVITGVIAQMKRQNNIINC